MTEGFKSLNPDAGCAAVNVSQWLAEQWHRRKRACYEQRNLL